VNGRESDRAQPPEGTMDRNAIAIHEVYLSYLRAGFDKDQALLLVLHHISEANRVTGEEA
jgi:hypothetical protein